MPVIMGTAGHIDHGKTTLVKALTGIDCDRLAEEKKRGITIELGFAYVDLPDGQRVSIVDVPGHERFVKNMVAGASGIDFVVLVIAADEGVMPQTREHLEICTLLGIEKGMVVLTKADSVDEEWMELVREDVSEFLAGSFLEDAPVLAVSSHTGQGLDELRAELQKLVNGLKGQSRSDLMRLPVDRVFSIKGHGTVVTGTLLSGSVSVGDDVELFPSGQMSKVRSVQSHEESVEKGLAGRRTAINLAGLDVADVQRGEVLGRPESLFPSLVWDVELKYLSSAGRELKHRKELHFHHGTRDVLARVSFPDRDKVLPGETVLCQVRFQEPMVGVYGDRVVLRSFSPLRTIAGGRIINPFGRKMKRFRDESTAQLQQLADGTSEDVIRTQLELSRAEGLSFAQLLTACGLEKKALEKVLSKLMSRSEIFLYDKESRSYISGREVERLCDAAEAAVRVYHEAEPMKQGIVRGELASGWGRRLAPKLFHFLSERLLRQKRLVAEAELLRLPQHKVSLASDQEKLKQLLVEAYASKGETPPNLKDVLEPLDLTFREAAPVFKLLLDAGELVKVKEEMYYHAPALAGIVDKVRAFITEHGAMSAADFKTLSGLSRKFAIPVLEYMDRERITMRVGDDRMLRAQR